MGSLDGKFIVVTGGTGSLGQALVGTLLDGEYGEPAQVKVFSRDEAKQHEMRAKIRIPCPIVFQIGDIRSYVSVKEALRGADIVIHLAALKHVPVGEVSPSEMVETNIRGAENIVRAVSELQPPPECIVGVSSDKACEPISVYGMTKAIMERIFVAANNSLETRFVLVRPGNFLPSRGSVIEVFRRQIEHGGPITVTHDDVTRFIMSVDDVVALIERAIRLARPGEIFIPKMRSLRIMALAQALKYTNPDIHVICTGLRPGEKLHEKLFSEDECQHVVRRGDIYILRPMLWNEPVSERQFTPVVRSDQDLMFFQEIRDFLVETEI